MSLKNNPFTDFRDFLSQFNWKKSRKHHLKNRISLPDRRKRLLMFTALICFFPAAPFILANFLHLMSEFNTGTDKTEMVRGASSLYQWSKSLIVLPLLVGAVPALLFGRYTLLKSYQVRYKLLLFFDSSVLLRGKKGKEDSETANRTVEFVHWFEESDLVVQVFSLHTLSADAEKLGLSLENALFKKGEKELVETTELHGSIVYRFSDPSERKRQAYD